MLVIINFVASLITALNTFCMGMEDDNMIKTTSIQTSIESSDFQQPTSCSFS